MNQAVLQQQKFEVSSYTDFVLWVQQNPDRHRGLAQIKMDNLKKELGGDDPLSYLYDLYYNQRKSLVEILKTEKISNIVFFPKATLHRLLFEKFGWTPRGNTERTPIHEKKLNEQVAGEVQEFETKVHGLLGGREKERIFRMSEFKEKTYRIGKALYILKTLGGIDKNILYNLSVEGGISNAVLAKSLNKELENILGRNPELNIKLKDIELYPQSIDRWFRYNTDRGNNSDK